MIDIPVDTALGEFTFAPPDGIDLPGYKPTMRPHIRQIRAAAKAINEAERPVLYIGGGVISSGAAAQILQLAEARRLPVATTFMGLGAFPETHELSMGMLGMHGTVTANYAVHECDLLIAIGARFDDRVTGKLKAFAPHAKIIHADVDPAEIGKNVAPLVPIVGDARSVATGLVKELEATEWSPERSAAWLARIAERKEEYPLHYEDPADGSLAPQYVIEEIDRVTDHDAVVCTDVGQHQMWATQYYTFTFPRQWISSGGLGTMGFGLPAAIGAKIGRPEATVINICGDGGFQMTMQELATAVNYNVPVVSCILNNGYLGMVRQWQDLFWGKRYSHTCIDVQPDFSKLAEAFGAVGMRVTTKDDVAPALEEAIASGRPAVIDFSLPGGERLPDGPGRQRDHRDDRRPREEREEVMKHTLSVLVENKPGVLTRVAGLFARRGFNIESLAVGTSEDPALSRITITIDGDEHPVDQVTKQLHKLINVVKIRDLKAETSVAAELLLVRVSGEGEKRTEVLQIAEIFKAKIVDVDRRHVTLRVVGASDKVEAILELLKPLGILEVVRTGKVVIGRGRG